MINVEFLIVTYLVSLFVDWVFQHECQAINKSKWGKNDNKYISWMALWSHAGLYAVLTSVITCIINNISDNYYHMIFLTLFISHAIIDTRIPVKWIMKLKGMSNEQINDYANYGFMHIGIDHRLHELIILILSMIVK